MEHDIITHDGIEILIKSLDDFHPLFTAHSEDKRFLEIFGTNELRIEGDGEDLADFVDSKVAEENKEKALEIIEVILKAI